MEIVVKKGKLSPFDTRLTTEAINYYLHQLVPQNQETLLGDQLKIELHLRKKMIPGDISATVDHDIYLEFSNLFSFSQNSFKLTVVKTEQTSTPEYLKLLAHECVHIKQALLQELKYFAEIETMQTVIVWRGRIMSDLSAVHHNNLPWEREAYAKQKPLSEKFILYYAEVIKKQQCTS